VRIFFRAFTIVTLTALNVTQVAQGHYVIAFVSGGLLSYVWWGNTRTAVARNDRLAQLLYSAGAACGTVTGMYLGRLLR
jgi:glucose-6-phosphate dehydrogenase assembly protein OpcA